MSNNILHCLNVWLHIFKKYIFVASRTGMYRERNLIIKVLKLTAAFIYNQRFTLRKTPCNRSVNYFTVVLFENF